LPEGSAAFFFPGGHDVASTRRMHSWILPVAALALVLAWWLWPANERATPARNPATASTSTPASASRTARAPTPGSGDVELPGGYVGPDPASLTPAEREALVAAEVAVSAAAEPPARYIGIDGKPKAFSYADDAAAARTEAARADRRASLRRELDADPAAFARRHQLSAKEVQWIVDGETDFPDRLIEP
jgi:hypothetical protein